MIEGETEKDERGKKLLTGHKNLFPTCDLKYDNILINKQQKEKLYNLFIKNV